MLFFFFLLLLSFQSLLLPGPLFCLFGEEILATFNLQINLALFLRRWKWRVGLGRFVGDLVGSAPLAQSFLLELGKESVPTFVLQSRVFGQFALDHQFFDVVDGVDVVHAIFDDSSHFFQALVSSHGADRVALHEDIGVGEQLQGFESGPVGPEKTLTTLHESFFVSDQVSNFDHIASSIVLKDFDSLEFL